jgi:hypothetical protein
MAEKVNAPITLVAFSSVVLLMAIVTFFTHPEMRKLN